MNRSLFILLIIFLAGCGGPKVQQVRTTMAKRGLFREELAEEGTLRAVNSIAIGAPAISFRYGSLKISRMVEDGKEVRQGDTLIIFDPSEIRKSIISAEQQLEIAQAEYDKLKAQQESEIEDLEADLEIARINQEISKINFDQAVFESEISRKEIKLKLETANIALDRANEQIVNRKKIHQEELFQKNISIKQLATTLKEANSSLSSLYVTSPAKGIAIIRENWMSGRKWQVGDQPYGTTQLIDLPDLSEMMADIRINEVDVTKVVPGLKTVIRADAYADTSYTARVTRVANLAQNKENSNRIKVFPAEIVIEGKPVNLLPGMTVSCRIMIREIPDVVYVPVEAVFRIQGIDYVYLRKGSGYNRQEVRTGPMNTDFAVILEGLTGNEEIAMTDPFINRQEKPAAGKNNGKAGS